ncbi:hypothetical protein SAMN05216593_11631 [Pseudomonas asturiensis]|uniref:Uncharacterized protein n=1 Tax=Pseudomonas asturiensis TaxID=1190415 RepID=A0A1M7Q0E4_9PSED|nr:hypothetical protein [Pseudomonas asturiensis]SHN23550.1 hypothetical protein SAMN05216593_11631 [Pseudomonas asturiensis]
MIDTHSPPTAVVSSLHKPVSGTPSPATKNISTQVSDAVNRRPDGATLSNLARQLNDSAARANSRDALLNSKELGTLARSVIDKLTDSSYPTNKAIHDAEVPDTQDPELLERARQATRFTNGQANNPFAGLSQDTLRLIIYDESGDFTLNERKAAYRENYQQQEIWNREMCQRYVDEYNETGKSTQTLFMILAHYNDLPPIEQAQYPADYVANLTSGDSSVMDMLNDQKGQSLSTST